MRTTSTFSVLFWVYTARARKNNCSILLARITGNKKRVSISLLASKLCAKTLCHYRTSQKYILAYVEDEYQTSDKYLRDLYYVFVLGLESFLRSYRPKHYQGKIGNNGVMKHIQRLRKMVTLANHIE